MENLRGPSLPSNRKVAFAVGRREHKASLVAAGLEKAKGEEEKIKTRKAESRENEKEREGERGVRVGARPLPVLMMMITW